MIRLDGFMLGGKFEMFYFFDDRLYRLVLLGEMLFVFLVIL